MWLEDEPDIKITKSGTEVKFKLRGPNDNMLRIPFAEITKLMRALNKASKSMGNMIAKKGKQCSDVASALKILRLEKGVTIDELSLKTGYSTTYLYKLEDGTKPPTKESVVRIVKALGKTLDEFEKSIK